jgi:peroxiredoxin
VSDVPGARTQDIDHGRVDRVTFVVRPDGQVAATIGGVAPVENVEKALETVTRLASATLRVIV